MQIGFQFAVICCIIYWGWADALVLHMYLFYNNKMRHCDSDLSLEFSMHAAYIHTYIHIRPMQCVRACACLRLCVSVCFPQLNTRVEFELFVLIAQIVHFVALTNTFHTASIHSTVHSHCQRECAKEGERSLSCSIAATFSVIVSTSCRQSARIFRLCACVCVCA